MQHIPLPKHPRYEPVLVPYLGSKRYDGFQFESYPSREGFENSKSWEKTELAAYFQRWLYFGVLSEFFGPENLERFICKGVRGVHGEYYVDSSPLLSLRYKVSGRRQADLSECIRRAVKVGESGELQNTLDQTTKLSLLVLYEELCGMLHEPHIIHWRSPTHLESLWEQLNVEPWCPFYMQWIVDEFRISSIYFLSQCQLPLFSESHVSCSKQACLVNQVCEENYNVTVRRHVDLQCRCRDIKIDGNGLCKIIENGDVPLLYYNEKKKCFEVRASELSISYVAISHVWADGLGNQSANGHYVCQIARVWASVNNVTSQNGKDPMPFWMDTLCCPVLQNPARKRLIARIDDIFRHATYVIVLDAYMLQQRTAEAMDLELCMKAFIAPWMTRLWTLQEGSSASSLYIACEDGLFQLNRIYAQLIQNDTLPHAIAEDLSHQASNFLIRYVFKRELYEDAHDLVLWRSLLRAVHKRRTSKPSDEVLCIASLAGLNISQLLEIQEKDRMAWVLSRMPALPQSIVFAGGTCIPKLGYRWAPTNLSQIRWSAYDRYLLSHERSTARLTSNGLEVSFPAILFLNPELYSSDEATRFIIARTSRGKWLTISLQGESDRQSIREDYNLGSRQDFNKVIVVHDGALDLYEDILPKSAMGMLALVRGNELAQRMNHSSILVRKLAAVQLSITKIEYHDELEQLFVETSSNGFKFANRVMPIPSQTWVVD